MKVIKSWLQQYTNLALSNTELVEIFSAKSGFDVEEVISTVDENIVVAKILKVLPHPNADKLRLAQVTDGTDTFDIVCGASNIEVGMIVPLAKIGAKVGEIVISAAEIRGEKSFGMLCSELELGLGEDHAGIMALSPDLELGTALNSVVESETLFDLEVTPNRGDCLSHIGVAREVAAANGASFNKIPIALQMSSKLASEKLKVEIKDYALCPRYLSRVIEGVSIGPSPEWLQSRLRLLGLSPINNVVDATNYIMFDLGQPLHAFDRDKVGGNIIVRAAKKNEAAMALDGKEYQLSTDDIVITNPEGVIAIAGVMGGYDSGISDVTTNIVLESAEFDPKNIRKTAKKLGLSSDASYRFERGIDSNSLEYSLNAAAKLIKEIAGGSILSGIVRAGEAFQETSVDIDTDKINSLLGTDLGLEQITRYLKLLGFKVSGNKCTVPSWRKDISLIEDLAEEVGRIYGYANIADIPVAKSGAPLHSSYYFKEMIKDSLVNLGFSEQFSYPFISEEDVRLLGMDKRELLEVVNPVQSENKYMRISLIPSLLKNIAKNGTFNDIRLFEINPVYAGGREEWKLVLGMNSKSSGDMQKVCELAAKQLAVDSKLFKIATYDREELAKYKIKKPLVEIAEADVAKLLRNTKLDWQKSKLRMPKNEVVYRPISKYPSLTRDLAFIVDGRVSSDEVESSIYSVSELINRVELFDEFASDKFGRGMKNIAYHIFLQAPDKTLRDDEAEAIVKAVVAKIEKEFKAKFRDR